jgi:hypothetical protein
MTKVRRIVMGDSAHAGPFTTVEDVMPVEFGPNSRCWHIWGWDQPPDLADPPLAYRARSHFPPPEGIRVFAQEVILGEQPETDVQGQGAEALAELISRQAHGRQVVDQRRGMHRTDSIDIGVVVSGAITVEEPSGTRHRLTAGDVYVQQGGTHAWLTDPTQPPARVVFVVLGAARTAATAATNETSP